jgi:hypothetical protein
MNISLKKFWNDNGIAGILIALVVAYVAYMFFNNLMMKGSMGSELMTQERNKAYNNAPSGVNPTPSEDVATSGNEVYSSVDDSAGNLSGMTPCNQNPADLLPSDANSQWAELNPSGKGELSNINLLKSGWSIGIDTISSSLRNPNLQIRSEPSNPQIPGVSIWNQSTITGDFLRPSLEIGQGSQ